MAAATQPSAEDSAATTTESGTSWSRACSAATRTNVSVRRAPARVSSRARSSGGGGFFTHHSVPGWARGIYGADAEDLHRALGSWSNTRLSCSRTRGDAQMRDGIGKESTRSYPYGPRLVTRQCWRGRAGARGERDAPVAGGGA